MRDDLPLRVREYHPDLSGSRESQGSLVEQVEAFEQAMINGRAQKRRSVDASRSRLASAKGTAPQAEKIRNEVNAFALADAGSPIAFFIRFRFRFAVWNRPLRPGVLVIFDLPLISRKETH